MDTVLGEVFGVTPLQAVQRKGSGGGGIVEPRHLACECKKTSKLVHAVVADPIDIVGDA